MEPLAIGCVTCGARLKIVDASKLGQVVACPRCHSMVELSAAVPAVAVAQPAGRPVEPTAAVVTSTEPSATDGSVAATPFAPALLVEDLPATRDESRWRVAASISVAIATLMALAVLWRVASLFLEATNETERLSIPATGISIEQQAATAPRVANDRSFDAEIIAPALRAEDPRQESPAETTPADRLREDQPTQSDPASKHELPLLTEEYNYDVEGEDGPAEPALTMPPPIEAQLTVRLRDDVEERLTDRWPRIVARNRSLAEYLSFVSEFSTLAVSVDGDLCQLAGVDLAAGVIVDLENVTSEEALLAARPGRLRCELDGDQVCLLPVAGQAFVSALHVTGDLAHDAAARQRLTELIRRMVLPETWTDAGGEATLEFTGDELAVHTSPLAQAHVARFLQRLRRARGIPLASVGPPESAINPARLNFAGGRQPLTANFRDGVSLARVSRYVCRHTKTVLLVDGPGLRRQGLGPESRVSLAVDTMPIEEMLPKLDEFPGVAVRTLGPRVCEITSERAALQKSEAEFHKLPQSATPHESIAARLRELVGPGGDVEMDLPSGSVIVRGLESAQSKISTLLAEIEAGGDDTTQ